MVRYVAAFILAGVVSLVVTPLVIRLAKARGLYDRPGLRKVHARPVPRVGGVAIAGSMMLGSLPVLLIGPAMATATGASTFHFGVLLALSGAMCVVGLVDDLRGLRASVKLAAQVAAALIACAAGIRMTPVGLEGVFELNFGWLSWPVTVLWIVGVTNAVNFIDGLDGLAAGIAAMTSAVIAVFALYTQQTVMAILMLAMVGSLGGFLVFNFNPAKVFMGDSGTLFLGFFLATASVMTATRTQTVLGLALPAMALGLPLFDTLFSILRRLAGRRSIFAPDRNHIHHRMLAMGMHQRKAVLVLYGVTALAGGLGALMMFMRHSPGVVAVFLAVVLGLVLVFRVTGTVRFRQYLRQIQQQLTDARARNSRQRKFDRLQLRLHEARDLHQWWRCLRLAAREMGFVGLRVELQDESAPPREWAAQPLGEDLPHVALVLSGQWGQGHPLRVALYLPADVSLESAGLAIALFGRLIENRDLRATLLPTIEPDAPAPLTAGPE